MFPQNNSANFLWMLDIQMAQVIEICHHERQGPISPAWPIQCNEPGHQQPWYWPCSPRIFQPQNQKGQHANVKFPQRISNRLTSLWLSTVSMVQVDADIEIQWGSSPGPNLNIKMVFPGMGIPIIKIRQSLDCLIFVMGIPIHYFEMVSWWPLLSLLFWDHIFKALPYNLKIMVTVDEIYWSLIFTWVAVTWLIDKVPV